MKRTLIILLALCLCGILAGCGAKNDDGPSSYVITFVDQHGAPVPGVTAQVCNDDTCMIYTSDDAGQCKFELAPFAYELHILKLPEGYSGDTESVTILSENGGETTLAMTKN